MLSTRKLLVAGLVSLVAASTAVAQDIPLKPWTFGVQAGGSVPTGDLSDGWSTGFNLGGYAGFKSPGIPVELRGELLYNSFGGKSIAGFELPSLNVLGFGGAVAYNIPSGLYLVGGLGLYNSSCEDCEGSTDLGLNGGAGWSMALSGFKVYVEGRFHTVMTEGSSTNFMPISFGLRF